ncbi:MAG: right-handed parallel beta-helix repeat-containing protein [Cytophagaceae bacterium]|nr:right-handed parallel beta-helix repeat-containing protein [Cytophagaceae bacterium]
MTIERNTVYNCDIGIELASEHAGKNTQDITVRNNFVSGSYQANIMAGGYASNRGNAVNIVIVNNTTYQASQGELALQFNCSNITIKNNIFYGIAGQDYLQEWGNNNTGIAVSNNLYFGQSTTSPGSWADARARYANPRITANPHMHLSATSLAIDAGLALGNDGSGNPLSGSLDIDKEVRVSNGAIEIGADEFASTLLVELINFSATADDKHCVVLSWQTGMEFNSDYFEAQHCTDVTTNQWESITHIPSAGFSTTLQSYTHQHCPATGISYYRLKQVDRDGQFSFSAIRAVQIRGNELQILLTNEGVGILSPETATASLIIYSELGQELVQQQIQLNANIYYPLSVGLKHGVYLFMVSTLEERVWKKIGMK